MTEIPKLDNRSEPEHNHSYTHLLTAVACLITGIAALTIFTYANPQHPGIYAAAGFVALGAAARAGFIAYQHTQKGP